MIEPIKEDLSPGPPVNTGTFVYPAIEFKAPNERVFLLDRDEELITKDLAVRLACSRAPHPIYTIGDHPFSRRWALKGDERAVTHIGCTGNNVVVIPSVDIDVENPFNIMVEAWDPLPHNFGRGIRYGLYDCVSPYSHWKAGAEILVRVGYSFLKRMK